MTKQDMRLAIVGHVDHGKSTIIGRMLADTGSLPEGKLESVKENCRRNSKPFEYAFLLDALKDEQSQGITIDSARIFFSTEKRRYTIMDAPGHIEFLKNMVTGASNAEAALLVIDAKEGIRENSKRHGYLLSMLGIRQIAVIINKMDLVDYSENVFKQIRHDYSAFLSDIEIIPTSFVPASGMKGDNIVNISANMKWYEGNTVLQTLDMFVNPAMPVEKPLRMPVQDVYKFTRDGDSRRIVSGRIESGTIKTGDNIMFLPSGKKSTVHSIEYFNGDAKQEDYSPNCTGFTLDEQIYIKRGQIAVKTEEKKPHVSTRIRANVFWLGRAPVEKGNEYYIKLGTAKVKAEVEEIIRVIDASSLDMQKKEIVERHDVAEIIFSLSNEIAFDLISDNPATGRFVIVDDYEISGGGIIAQLSDDKNMKIREKVLKRDEKWIVSDITSKERALRFNQKSALILISGKQNSGRKRIARSLESELFNQGRIVYYLGMGNVLYGVDADIKVQSSMNNKEEHIRRLAEIANILLDAGIILIVTMVELTEEDRKLIQTIIETDNIFTLWTGGNVSTDIAPDIRESDRKRAVYSMINLLRQRGHLFNPE